MRATDLSRRTAWRRFKSQSGTTAAEFALLAVIFFSFVFGLIETARLLFVYNTLQEVTRRAAMAAAGVYASDTDGIAAVKNHAVFRNSAGGLLLAPPVTHAHVRLDYLRYDLSVIPQANWPASAAANRQLCMLNPRAQSCIRFVQARICDIESEADCAAVTSQMMLPLIDLRVPLHRATTIVPVETFGYVPGTPPPTPPTCSVC